jgi:hypothetical protein
MATEPLSLLALVPSMVALHPAAVRERWMPVRVP